MFKLNTFNGTITKIDTGERIKPPYADPVYLEYADWVIAGNTPETYEEVEYDVPEQVSSLQAKAALAAAGLLDAINTYMSNPATSIIAKLAWQEAGEFRRNSPLVANIASMYSLTPQQLDELFIEAKKIEV